MTSICMKAGKAVKHGPNDTGMFAWLCSFLATSCFSAACEQSFIFVLQED